MQNTDIYGHAKVNREMLKRGRALASLPSVGERAARFIAWKLFISDHVKPEDCDNTLLFIGGGYYGEALVMCRDLDGRMDIDPDEFKRYFVDECNFIVKAVTAKSVQATYYIFAALGLFGLYKILF